MTKPAKTQQRIAFLLPDLGGGGAERVALTLMGEYARAGQAVDLLLVQKFGAFLPLVPEGVRIVDLGSQRLRKSVLPLVHYFRRNRPDVLHAFMWPLTLYAIIAKRLARARTRLVVSDHTTLSNQYGDSPWVFAALKATIRLFYPMADVRVLCSREAADDLARLSGIPRDRLDVAYNPILPPALIRTTPEAEQHWGDTQHRIITVGSLKDQKNHELLIRSFARVRRKREARLMIVGTGPLLGRLKQVAAEEGVADDVILPGFVLDPWPYYASANLFVLSSDYEGFGNVLTEAMFAGLPVVSTDCESGPAEILQGGRCGRLVPCRDPQALADAIEAALDEQADPERQKARADEVSGSGSIRRYMKLMGVQTGEESQ